MVISHGSQRSLQQHMRTNELLAAGCAALPQERPCARAGIKHVDAISMNELVGAAQRFFTAVKNTTNDVVVHLDDDLVPTESLLQALIDAVSLELPGRPLGIYGPSGLARSCGPRGYTRGYETPDEAHRTVLTQLAATSTAANHRYVHEFAQSWQGLLEQTRGNGAENAHRPVLQRAHNPRGHAWTRGRVTSRHVHTPALIFAHRRMWR